MKEEEVEEEAKTIEESWKLFEEAVVPEAALEQQTRDMRVSFYAGASACFERVLYVSETHEADDAKASEILRALHTEVAEFLAAQALTGSNNVSKTKIASVAWKRAFTDM